MFFFTADEHHGHSNVIKYSHRPFGSSEEMTEALVTRHNEVVGKGDVVVHAGDFTLAGKKFAEPIVARLKGTHIFLLGNHDRWLPKKQRTMWSRKIEDEYVVVCHYPFRSWKQSIHGSWNLHGHSHGMMTPVKNQFDIGVDANNYYPVSFAEVAKYIHGEYENLSWR